MARKSDSSRQGSQERPVPWGEVESRAMTPAFWALAAAAASVGALHSGAPDHWAPFAALARARGWSACRTARITLLGRFGHVTVSAARGLAALLLRMQALRTSASRLAPPARPLS